MSFQVGSEHVPGAGLGGCQRVEGSAWAWGLFGTHEPKPQGTGTSAVAILTLLCFFLSFSHSFTMKGSTSHDDFKFKVSPTSRRPGGSPQPGPHLPGALPLPSAPTQYCLQLGMRRPRRV